ncbi:cation transporter [Conyzicola nivalis]|uniref:Cation diffusion facilitator transporter n=1 Tax=Conyzicola nivalis TaxID=1477021 RepID=A0A916SH63_9MICO|nr:cation diffusion facilitator family transporter [Conyzicola nivalis]GGA98895.1 cation diffusion facilitator transporter [Conyzicola nivalis]
MANVSLTVVLAFVANLVVALGKSFAAALTGSASMTAEAAHSWADVGNEIFLLVADRRGSGRADKRHPLGYGREAYFWSTIAAFGLFTAGAVVSIWHGIQELIDPEPAADYWIAYLVLGVSAVLEGVSFAQALRQSRAGAKQRRVGTLRFVLGTSNPTLRAVFAEDAAALVGLAIAFVGILLHQVTGSPVFDAIGSILVGVLLGVVAVVLIDRNRRFLVGQGAGDELNRTVIDLLLERPAVDRVTYIHLEYVGPERVFLVAAVDLRGDDTETNVAIVLRRLERELEQNEHIEEAILTLSTPDDASL